MTDFQGYSALLRKQRENERQAFRITLLFGQGYCVYMIASQCLTPLDGRKDRYRACGLTLLVNIAAVQAKSGLESK